MTMVAAHRNGVHGLPHSFGRDLIRELAFALSHGAGGRDGGNFTTRRNRGARSLSMFSPKLRALPSDELA